MQRPERGYWFAHGAGLKESPRGHWSRPASFRNSKGFSGGDFEVVNDCEAQTGNLIKLHKLLNAHLLARFYFLLVNQRHAADWTSSRLVELPRVTIQTARRTYVCDRQSAARQSYRRQRPQLVSGDSTRREYDE